MMDTRKNLINTWGSQNITFFEETIWSSSIQQLDLPKVRDFLEANNFNFFDVSIVRPPKSDLSRILWKYHYDETGQCISTNYQKEILENSNHFKLVIGLEEKENNNAYQNKTISIINILRLVFGVPIAKELMLLNHFNKDDHIGLSNSKEGFASPFLNQSLNMFPDIKDVRVKDLPVEAAILLDKAFEQDFPIERFILMWTSFEAIINHIEKGSKNNGLKRKNHFEKLGSEIISNEVTRLVNIRCHLFKEAKFLTSKQMEDENWSLYAIIQLTVMEDCPVKTKFLKGYENLLEERNSLSKINLKKEHQTLP